MAITVNAGGANTGISTGDGVPGGYYGGHDTPSGSQSTQRSQSNQQSTSQQQSSTYIPEYSQTPILNEIAQYARGMAPQVYQWGMEQYGKNQGNIDAMMRNALSYASPQRVASEMGKAEAGVQQGAEAGRQASVRDLESYGIDPSSGRYAALDNASRVMAGAAAAGAGNQQRTAVETAGAGMAKDAMGMSLQNVQTGYGASNAMNQLLGTGMQLKYSPLGTTSSGYSQMTGESTGSTDSESWATPTDSGGSKSTPSAPWPTVQYHKVGALAEGGLVAKELSPSNGEVTTGGFVSNDLSPSNGSQTDDVDARLNAGEFVIPKDVAQWKGQEFFYKLMAQARKMRATSGDGESSAVGYGAEDYAPHL